jgi:quinol-cytochrome oxidoreductase complex cytochrome b subunit
MPEVNWRLLKVAAVTYVVVEGLHILDHLRQGRASPAQVYVAGITGLIAALVVLGVVLAEHRLAPLTAGLFGTVDALGVFSVHLVPPWFFLSDSYFPLHLDAASWISAIVLVLAAAGLALAGWSQLRRSGWQLPDA